MQVLTPLRRRLLLLLAVAGMGLYVAFGLAVSAEPLRAALTALGWPGVLAVLGLSAFNYLLRYLRWAGYLRLLGYHPPAVQHALYYFGGFAFTVSPGKAGEAVRALYLKPHGVPWSASLAALFSERLMDVLTMVLLALLLVTQVADAAPVVATLGFIFLGVTVLAGRPLWPQLLRRLALRRGPGAARALGGLAATLESSARLLQPQRVALGLLIGLLAWGAEGYGLYLLARGLNVSVDAWTATGIYALSVLAGAASFFMPGGLGGMEAAMTALFTAQGASVTAAFAITVLCRVATLWFAVVLGILALLWLELFPPRYPS